MWWNDFSKEQLEEIVIGYDHGLTKEQVNIYAKECFDEDQMAMIREGLEEGIDVSIYAKPSLIWTEMKEIKEKIESGLDLDYL